GILRTRLIGLTGTLDPDAEGVLPICVGKATKVADAIMGSEKVYEAALRFGCETDTQDASGTVTRTYQYDFCQEEAMAAISSFIGEYEQIPPMYSAVKVGGLKLYELARQGVEVERKARRVVIHEIQALNLQETGAAVRSAARREPIRTPCEDIGRRLGYGAHMQTLIRLQSGRFTGRQPYPRPDSAVYERGTARSISPAAGLLF
ncbi:MAG: tRNA pseudouridine(55) synthase TruB, partial [Clostridia bacterium]